MKSILDIRVQVRIYHSMPRETRCSIDLVGDRQSFSAFCCTKGWSWVKSLLFCARRQKQLVHHLPGNIVADRHAGVENEAVRCAVISDVACQHHGIRDGDIHIFCRTHTRHEQIFLNHFAFRVGNPDIISHAEAAHVSDDRSRHHIGNSRCRAQR